jgi:hypothetical protein
MAGMVASFPLSRCRTRWRDKQPPMLLLIPLIRYDDLREGDLALSVMV